MPKPSSTPIKPPLHLGLVLFPGCMPAGLFAAADIARAANLRAGRDCFRITWAGIDKQGISTWQGPTLQPQATLAELDCDIWLVPGLWVMSKESLAEALHSQQALIKALRKLPQTAEIWSYCAGVPLVAAAGRLDGKAATATWWMHDTLTALFPKVDWRFDEPFVRDGAVETASGPHGYLSIMIERLGRLLGQSAFHDLEKMLVLPKPRAEYGLFLAVDLMHLSDPELRRLLLLAQRTKASELTLTHAAALMNISVRTLCRHVLTSTGIPAGEWLRRVKLRQVGEALTRTDQPIKLISDTLGFSSEAGLHRAFRQTTGYTPAQFRRTYTETQHRFTPQD